MTPTSEVAKRIAALAHRRLTTPWLPKEVKQFRFLVSAGYFKSLDDLALVERFYEAQRKRGPDGTHRRDLYTLINNWAGEVDKANDWAERHPIKTPPRKIIPLPPTKGEPYVAPTDPEELARLARFEAERLQRKKERHG